MGRAEESITIGRSAEDVFAYVTDPANDTIWRSGVVESELLGGAEPKVGSRLRTVQRFVGKRIETVSEVTQWDPPNRAAVRALKGPFAFDAEYRFEPENGACRMTAVAEIGGFGGFFGKLADPIVLRMGVRQLRADLENLKEILESSVEGELQAQS